MIRSMSESELGAGDGKQTKRLTAKEASARLGVKVETLYAYVSRGMLESLKDDGRHASFDPLEVDALRMRRRGRKSGRLEVPVATAITKIADHHVSYRGHDAVEMAEDGVPFEAVAQLLWTGDLDEDAWWKPDRTAVTVSRNAQTGLPSTAPTLDRLRLTCAALSANDPLRGDLRLESVAMSSQALVAGLVDGLPVVGADSIGRLPDRLWSRLSPHAPTPLAIDALNAALVLLADHGLAVSTLAARVAGSARCDPYSVVTTGLGVIGGPLHGAASRPLYDAFNKTAATGSAGAALADLVASAGPLPGFGHFLYPDGDPRCDAVLYAVRQAAGPNPEMAAVDSLMHTALERDPTPPNVDFGLAALAFVFDMPPDAGEAIFSIARSVGWIAHALEEYGERPLRFRPVSRYTGP
jgi:citrate synthase